MKQKPSYSNDRRIVILGASGFVGKRLKEKLLCMGNEIFAPPSSEINLLDPSSAEILKKTLNPTDIVVMLACIPPDMGRDYKTFKNNLIMAETLCDALKSSPVNHFLYLSSDAVFSSSTEQIYDDALPSPDSLYGLMHRTREILFCDPKHAHNFTILRPTMIIGSEDTHNAYGPNKFLRSVISTNEITLFGHGEDVKDYIYIDDAVEIIVRAINESISGTFNLASGNSLTVIEMASLIIALTNNLSEIIYTPRIVPVTRRYFNIQRLLQTFAGFTPKPLAEAIQIMYNEMKKISYQLARKQNRGDE